MKSEWSWRGLRWILTPNSFDLIDAEVRSHIEASRVLFGFAVEQRRRRSHLALAQYVLELSRYLETGLAESATGTLDMLDHNVLFVNTLPNSANGSVL